MSKCRNLHDRTAHTFSIWNHFTWNHGNEGQSDRELFHVNVNVNLCISEKNVCLCEILKMSELSSTRFWHQISTTFKHVALNWVRDVIEGRHETWKFRRWSEGVKEWREWMSGGGIVNILIMWRESKTRIRDWRSNCVNIRMGTKELGDFTKWIPSNEQDEQIWFWMSNLHTNANSHRNCLWNMTMW
jgi:hypothetical protein